MNKYLFKAYNVAGAILKARNRTVNNTENAFAFTEYVVWEEKTKPK